METRTMDWLSARDIAWLPVLLRVENGKKIFLSAEMKTTLGYVPKTDMFLKYPDRVKKYQQQFRNTLEMNLEFAERVDGTWVLAVDTSDVYIMDVDHEDGLPLVEELMKKTPYYLSFRKKFPKIFLMDSKMATADVMTIGSSHFNLKNDNIKFFNGNIELQKGLWSYMPMDTTIQNANNEIVEFDTKSWLLENPGNHNNPSFSPSTPVFKPVEENKIQEDCHFFKDHITFKLVRCLNPERAIDFKSWFDVACALKSSQYPYAFQIWRIFSMMSPQYKEENFEEGGCDRLMWDRLVPRRTIGSLHFWAKQDNRELYNELFGTSYETIKNNIETILFKIKNPVSFIVLHDEIDIIKQDGGKLQILKRNDVRTRFEEDYFTEEQVVKGIKTTVSYPFIDRWLKDPNKRVYDGLTFDPSSNVPHNYFNMYKGLAVNSLLGGDYDEWRVDKMKEYLFIRLSGEHTDFFNFFLLWQARIVQQPDNPTQVCLVIKSPHEGCGKGMFCNFFGRKVLGYYLQTAKPKNILGQFNGLLENKLLVNLNEITIQDTYNERGSLNELITDPFITIERKGIDSFSTPNRLNFIATTQNNGPFPMTFHDRRYACVETNCPIISDDQIQYWLDFFDHPNTAFSWYKYLMTLDVPLSLQHCRPNTPFYRECKILTSSPYIHFWIYILNLLPKPLPQRRFYSYDFLYDNYKSWKSFYHASNDNPEKYKSFCVKIKKFPFMVVKRNQIDNIDKMGVSVEPVLLLDHLKDYNEQVGDEDVPLVDKDELGGCL